MISKNIAKSLCMVAFFLGGLTSHAATSNIHPARLRVEHMENLGVVDVLSPRLSWVNEVEGGLRAQRQSALLIEGQFLDTEQQTLKL